MIMNMIGSRAEVKTLTFSLDSAVTYPSYLQISDVVAPLGEIHGFVLIKNDGFAPDDYQIVTVYSTEEMANQNRRISCEYYLSSASFKLNWALTPTESSYTTGGYAYNDSTHTLTIYQNLISSSFGTGAYRLFYW